jgi:aryl-alcohol dehydrogenase-like predicted oxidoreductase
MKLGLGTVQFGLGYGISNATGKPPLSEVARILAQASDEGVDTLDTAAAYGEAETVLGQLSAEAAGFRIISKVSAQQAYQPGAVRNSVENSLRRVRRERLDGLLLHRADDLLEGPATDIVAEMQAMREEGRVGKLGVSVYSPEQLEAVLANFAPDLVQLPCSLLDQRFLVSGWLGRLTERGVEIHIRSVFLQGLLLMAPADRPIYFKQYSASFDKFDRFCDEHVLSPLQAALGFTRKLPADLTLVGVNRSDELQGIAAAWDVCTPELDAYADLSSTESGLILPTNWAT